MPIRLWAAAAACLLLSSNPVFARGPMEPVLFGGSMDQPACGNSGTVVETKDQPLTVREGPSMDFGTYGELQTGAIVHLCDEEQGWWGIVYGDEDCEVSAPIYERRPYDGPCHSGWIGRDAVR